MKKIIILTISILYSLVSFGQIDYENQYKYYQTGSSPAVKNFWKYTFCKDTTTIADSVWVCDTAKVLRYRQFINQVKCDSDLVSTDTLVEFQRKLISGTNIKTINGNSILGSGNLVVTGSGDNLGNHTAEQNLDMDSYDINNVNELFAGTVHSANAYHNDIYEVYNLFGNAGGTFSMDNGYWRVGASGTNEIDLLTPKIKLNTTSYRYNYSNSDGKLIITHVADADSIYINGKEIVGKGFTPTYTDDHYVKQARVKELIDDSTDVIITALAGKANTSHTHTISNVTGLQDSLTAHKNMIAVKLDTSATISTNKLKQLGATTGQVVKWNGTAWAPGNDATGSATPHGSTGDIQINNAGSFGTATNLTTEDNNLKLKDDATIPSVASGGVELVSQPHGDRNYLNVYGSTDSYVIGKHFNSVRYNFMEPVGATSFYQVGMNLGGTGTQGTITAPSYSTSTEQNKSYRIELLRTSANAANVAGFINQTASYLVDKKPSYFSISGPATGVSTTTHRWSSGFTASTGVSDVDPSTYTDCMIFGYDDDDTNIQFMHNDGSGTCTKVDLGSNFPVPTADRTNWYEMHIDYHSATSCSYYIRNITTGNTASGTVTTNLPASGTFVTFRNFITVGGTSSVIGVAISYISTESQH